MVSLEKWDKPKIYKCHTISKSCSEAWVILMLVVANSVNTKWRKKAGKMSETMVYGYSSESTQCYLMNTNMTGCRYYVLYQVNTYLWWKPEYIVVSLKKWDKPTIYKCHTISKYCSEAWVILMLVVANSVNTKWRKKSWKNIWNHGIWVLIWEYSVRAILWIPTWQGVGCFQTSLPPCALDESSLSMGLIEARKHWCAHSLDF